MNVSLTWNSTPSFVDVYDVYFRQHFFHAAPLVGSVTGLPYVPGKLTFWHRPLLACRCEEFQPAAQVRPPVLHRCMPREQPRRWVRHRDPAAVSRKPSPLHLTTLLDGKI